MTDCYVKFGLVLHSLCEIWDFPDFCQDQIGALKGFGSCSNAPFDQSSVKLSDTNSYPVPLLRLLYGFAEHLHGFDFFILFQGRKLDSIPNFHHSR